MNYDRIYEYRFKNVNSNKKNIAWTEIANFIYQKLSQPQTILDPAAGNCEFINAVPSPTKWAVDLNEKFINQHVDKNVIVITGNIFDVELPDNFFDGIFISNFLEHLTSQEQVAELLEKMYSCTKPGGKIALMGPNFKYAFRSYFDFADHTVILSELGLAEHLFGAGFNIVKIYPRFLPLSFRGNFPVNKFLVRSYLSMPLAWKFFGKQFLVIGQK